MGSMQPLCCIHHPKECTVNSANTPMFSCIQACQSCATACDRCFSACLQEDDVKMMVRCITLDADCAAVCSFAASAMARGSEHAKAVCDLCADICRACGDECAKHQAVHCQECASACRQCAEECARMALTH